MSLSTADLVRLVSSLVLNIGAKMLIVETNNVPIAIIKKTNHDELVETTVSEVCVCELFTIYKFE